MSGLPAMRVAAATCATRSGEQEQSGSEGGTSCCALQGGKDRGGALPLRRQRGTRDTAPGTSPAFAAALRSTTATNKQPSQSETKRAAPSISCSRDRNNRSAQASTHLNPADAASHDAPQDAHSPAPRRPRAHVHAGRRGRQPVACRRRKADRSALQLSWPQRDACVAAGRRRLLEREGMIAGQVQADSGGGDDVERRVDLRALVERKAQAPAEVEVVAFDRS